MDLTTVFTVAAGCVGAFFGAVFGGFTAYPDGNIGLRAVGGAVLGAAILGGGLFYGAKWYNDRPAASLTEGFTLSSQDRARVRECLDSSPANSVLTLSRNKDGAIGCTVSIP